MVPSPHWCGPMRVPSRSRRQVRAWRLTQPCPNPMPTSEATASNRVLRTRLNLSACEPHPGALCHGDPYIWLVVLRAITQGGPPRRARRSPGFPAYPPGGPHPLPGAPIGTIRAPALVRRPATTTHHATLSPSAVADGRADGRRTTHDGPSQPSHASSSHRNNRSPARSSPSAQPRAHERRSRSPKPGRPGQMPSFATRRRGAGRPPRADPGRETGVRDRLQPSFRLSKAGTY